MTSEIILENRKARFDYELLEKFEAGMELLGFEVKTLREKKGSLSGSYIIIRGGEAYLVGMTIPPYEKQSPKSLESHDQRRLRKLLLNKKEIRMLEGFESNKGLTIIPTVVYNKGRHIKISIVVAKGKAKFDKRESIKKREAGRDMSRALKRAL